ncbi:MAG: tRNA (adenosine(37)-N6)-threonylcarbamoyltransferase complex ATPase subunit type 1 TsaE [Flavobacteriaceae bacterium]|jgi:tRNA threonylcarbamoyladenosine biosynthesis protein TsaE|nr:tRNA (adenosine(37)-N6)-threonylcarbamoyltransferase complex ATPase subunit type 1 TsaE [Flavobacteriaceae bacterium]
MGRSIIYSIGEIEDVAKKILSLNLNSKIYILDGVMGSGKTTLIKSIVEKLGINGIANSPTFSIINEYSNGDKIYHFDFYRIKNKNELLDIGIDEYVNGKNICFIEWPDLVVDMLPKNYNTLKLEVVSNNERRLTIS